MTGIYMYENKKTHKKYIGQSTNIERRRKEHLKWPSPYSYFDQELKKIGEEQFDFVILEECDAQVLDLRETYWIKYYDTVNTGYNLTYGGQTYRGESNPYAKLTEDDVRQIIILLEEHQLNNKEIAKVFNVHYNTIDNINQCKTWSHLHTYHSNIRQANLNKEQYPHSSLAGENNPTSKMKEDDILHIIDLIKNSTLSLAAIAKQCNVKDSLVYDINRCRTWKYLHHYKHNIRKESYEERGDANNEE